MDPTVLRILQLCRTLRCQTAQEKVLQDALEPLLRAEFQDVEREARLSQADVLDFLVAGRIVVEVKMDQSPMTVTRQLRRYAEHPKVTHIVLVTTRAKHRSVPLELAGKPVFVAWLQPM